MTNEFHKYPKIKMIGHLDIEDIFVSLEDEIVIEEKIDGANFRFMIDRTTRPEKIIFGSRNLELKTGNDNGGNWSRCIEFITNQTAKCKWPLKMFSGHIFYGECCFKHSMNYDWEKIPPFLGFDVYHILYKRFLSYEGKVKMFKELNLPIVPLIKIVRAKDIKGIVSEDVPVSAYASPSATPEEKFAEGIIFKNYSKQMFGKFVRPKFKETNKEAVGQSKKFADTDNKKMVAVYCTNSRIEKCVFKLVDEGNKLEIPLMAKLPTMVWLDIWEENWEEIVRTRWDIHLGNCKKSVTQRCLKILHQCMTNNALNNKVEEDDYEPGTCTFCGKELDDGDHENSCMECE